MKITHPVFIPVDTNGYEELKEEVIIASKLEKKKRLNLFIMLFLRGIKIFLFELKCYLTIEKKKKK